MIRPPTKALLTGDGSDMGIKGALLLAGLTRAYETLDAIDGTLETMSKLRLADIVELANLSSMIGNIIAQGIVAESKGVFQRAGPHKYQDLRGGKKGIPNIEIKMALDTNKPKGHLPKEGHYLACRYVLCDASGAYERGKENRGILPRIWEIRGGELMIHHFGISNTAGDSGKTAVVTKEGMRALQSLYFDPELCPFASVDRYLKEYS